ncbi:hypothetical protein H696_05333 [Fonticula alba]|uniref:Beta-lactamase-related domain-containing protein n=1 Tax=Fonticula alba TaxID=691883 RepID=A0A058Z1T2_FONAL|nr:hypothetical protein H696_05333 [Fonticula alba]KCV68081.1 hypothetical protein H696_05333 [Fonticula alba]|eukprot:XP_009497455.1 hypothetical protein H696_05333 [Fonticula alba]
MIEPSRRRDPGEHARTHPGRTRWMTGFMLSTILLAVIWSKLELSADKVLQYALLPARMGQMACGHVAKTVCSAHYVSGRSLEDIDARGDVISLARGICRVELFEAGPQAPGPGVRATGAGGLFEAEAYFQGKHGCFLAPASGALSGRLFPAGAPISRHPAPGALAAAGSGPDAWAFANDPAVAWPHGDAGVSAADAAAYAPVQARLRREFAELAAADARAAALAGGASSAEADAAADAAAASATPGTRAMVVVHRGRLVAEAYAPGLGPMTPLGGWSMAKSLTNAVAGTLAFEGGCVRLDAPVRPSVPEWWPAAPPSAGHSVYCPGAELGESLLPAAAPEHPPEAEAQAEAATATAAHRHAAVARRFAMSPAPAAGRWAADPLGQMSLWHLLSQSSGLSFDESYGLLNDPARMLFLEPSSAGYAAALEHGGPGTPAVPPGSRFLYTSGNTNLAERVVQTRCFGRLVGEAGAACDPVPGSQAPAEAAASALAGGSLRPAGWQVDYEAYWGHVHRSLFQPLGMSTAVFERDAAGLQVGSSFAMMSGRDWARLAYLFLRGGEWVTADGRPGARIVPREWVDASTRPTPVSGGGHGLHWWTSATADGDTGGDVAWHKDLPKDLFYMGGFEGQLSMVDRASDLVIIRLGKTKGGFRTPKGTSLVKDVREMAAAAAAVVAAVADVVV